MLLKVGQPVCWQFIRPAVDLPRNMGRNENKMNFLRIFKVGRMPRKRPVPLIFLWSALCIGTATVAGVYFSVPVRSEACADVVVEDWIGSEIWLCSGKGTLLCN